MKYGRLATYAFVLAVVIGLVIRVVISGRAYQVVAGLTRYVPWRISGLPLCPNCNVVIISLESLRADELPCYGYGRNTMPRLCVFAGKNSLFTNFYSQSSLTLDTTFSIITGLYPSTHHVINILNDELNESIPTLAQIFGSHGYTTIYAGNVDDPNMPIDKGLGRGFTEMYEMTKYDNVWVSEYERLLPKLTTGKPTFMFLYDTTLHPPFLPGNGPRTYVAGDYENVPVTPQQYYPNMSWEFMQFVLAQYETRLLTSDTLVSKQRNTFMIDRLKAAMKQHDITAAKSIVFQLPAYEHHDLYAEYYWYRLGKPTSEINAYLRGLYDEQLTKLDNMLTPLLSFLERPDVRRNTIVIITSPHGEAFGEKGELEHGNTINNVVTHVPFILAAPKISVSRPEVLSQSIDIFPTVLDLTGIRVNTPYEGISLVPYVTDTQGVSPRPYVISEHRNDFIRSIQDNTWKLYRYKDVNLGIWYVLYNLKNDPQELTDVVEEHSDIRLKFSQALEHTLNASPVYKSNSRGFPEWIDTQKRQEIINNGYF